MRAASSLQDRSNCAAWRNSSRLKIGQLWEQGEEIGKIFEKNRSFPDSCRGQETVETALSMGAPEIFSATGGKASILMCRCEDNQMKGFFGSDYDGRDQ